MLGYSENQKAYRVMEIATGNVFSSRSVTFVETAVASNDRLNFNVSTIGTPVNPVVGQAFDTPVSPAVGQVHPVGDDDVDMTDGHFDQNMDNFVVSNRSSKVTAVTESPRSQLDDISDRHVNKRMTMPNFNLDDGTDVYCLVAEIMDEQASTYEQIMKSDNRDQWQKAMDNEMKSINSQNTWILKPLPDGKKLVGSRWIFKIKKNSDGEIARWKARFCAKGFTQVAGIDFHETYAPVAKMNSIRLILSIVTTENLELHQADVDTAFLYGLMDAEVYIKQPTGYIEPGKEDWACLLLKSLYGTKQAARQWYKKVHGTMTKNGFIECQSDNCVYVRYINSEFSIIALYFDDLIIASTTINGVKTILDFLKKDFSIKELGELNYCLGIKVDRNRITKKLFLSQTSYIEQLINKFQLNECKPCFTPANLEPLVKSDGMSNVIFPYREAVGSMMYLMLCTRPDIANALGCVAKY